MKMIQKIKKKRKRKEQRINSDITPLITNNKYQNKIDEEKKEISTKSKVRKNHSRKDINNFKIMRSINEEKLIKELDIKMPKVSSKFSSQIELKKFNDKSLNRIKPTKVPKPKYTQNNLKFPEFNKNNRNSSIRSDYSLMQLLIDISIV